MSHSESYATRNILQTHRHTTRRVYRITLQVIHKTAKKHRTTELTNWKSIASQSENAYLRMHTLLRVATVTAGLAESNGSLPPVL